MNKNAKFRYGWHVNLKAPATKYAYNASIFASVYIYTTVVYIYWDIAHTCPHVFNASISFDSLSTGMAYFEAHLSVYKLQWNLHANQNFACPLVILSSYMPSRWSKWHLHRKLRSHVKSKLRFYKKKYGACGCVATTRYIHYLLCLHSARTSRHDPSYSHGTVVWMRWFGD